MYRQFNIQQFYILPTLCVYVFVWISEQTAIISLYNINWLVFITEIWPFKDQWSLYVPPV